MRRPLHYRLLPDHSIEPVDDLTVWAQEFEQNRRVARDQVDDYVVSTVFLGIDHAWDEEPLVFETMIFDANGEELYQARYATWDRAVTGHEWVTRVVQEQLTANRVTMWDRVFGILER